MAQREKCVCGGLRHQHDNDPEGCWCYQCLKKQDRGERRCQGFVTADTEPAVDRNVPFVGMDHPDTAQRMQDKTVGEAGTLRRAIHQAVKVTKQSGLTDDDLEQMLERSHQSVSGARNTLMKDGLVVDSGRRRKNRYGNDSIVWVTPFYR